VLDSLTNRISRRLRELRIERGWSLEQLASYSSVSRASLSRLENGEVSPTATVLGKLCFAYGMTVSSLIANVEVEVAALIRADEQNLFVDNETGLERYSVSPPGSNITGEIVEVSLAAGARVHYDKSPVPGLQHHLVMISGTLVLQLDETEFQLRAGDCLRYKLFGSSDFYAVGDDGAKYLLFMA